MARVGIGRLPLSGSRMAQKQVTNMLGGMRANNVSLTRSSTFPGEVESKAWATALSMLEVASANKAAGIPLLVASPTTTLTRPSSNSKKS